MKVKYLKYRSNSKRMNDSMRFFYACFSYQDGQHHIIWNMKKTFPRRCDACGKTNTAAE